MVIASPLKADEHETGGAVDIDGNVTFESLVAFTVQDRLDDNGALASVLGETGIEQQILNSQTALKESLARRAPDIVFLDVVADSTQAVDSLFVLGNASYPGIVQLIGNGAFSMDGLLHTGKRLGLQMLPALTRPLTEAAIAEVLESEGLRARHLGQPTIDLNKALRNGWVEFWYQPKIELRAKHIVGIEALARVRQPNRGVLAPWSFLAGADERGLIWLSEKALINALNTSEDIANIGVKLQIAVNVSVKSLSSILLILSEFRPKIGKWPGLLLDITEDEIATDILQVSDLMGDLRRYGIKLAIDDYKGEGLTITQLRKLGCAELKLSKRFVTGCHVDSTKAAVCEQMTHLVHSVGGTAVAIGIERAVEIETLKSMGCDVGQGFLFGQPMPHERLLGLLGSKVSQTKYRSAISEPYNALRA
jgi:EAL domain-containing protein (putative c-di-GMP-specific phosphodiesterase class I)